MLSPQKYLIYYKLPLDSIYRKPLNPIRTIQYKSYILSFKFLLNFHFVKVAGFFLNNFFACIGDKLFKNLIYFGDNMFEIGARLVAVACNSLGVAI